MERFSHGQSTIVIEDMTCESLNTFDMIHSLEGLYVFFPYRLSKVLVSCFFFFFLSTIFVHFSMTNSVCLQPCVDINWFHFFREKVNQVIHFRFHRRFLSSFHITLVDRTGFWLVFFYFVIESFCYFESDGERETDHQSFGMI